MLMKKILLSLAAVALSAVAATSVQAQEKKLVDMTGWQLYANDYDAETQSYIPRKLDEPTLSDYSRYYYNAKNEQAVEVNSYSQMRYTYNADGTIATRSIVSDTSYGHSEIEWRYTYSTLDPSLIPQGLTCDGTIGGNEVYVKWNAVAGAEKYLVMYDNQTAVVEGKTDFITPMLNDGEHQVAVLAYVGGEQKNITDFAKVSVKDEGNLPLQNFQVTAAEKVDVESYGYVNQYYNLTLSWTVPEGASKITDYKVYVDKGESWNPSTTYTMAMPEAEKQDSYNDVNTWVTNRQNFYWTTFENTYYDEDTWQTVSLGNGPDVKMWITAIYASGESQKSNVVELNVYNLANGGSGETDVKAVKAATADAPVEIFNVAGQQIKKANGRQLILIRQGNEVKKVLK